MTTHGDTYPTLVALMDAGHVWINHAEGAYLGLASDGTEVLIGSTFKPAAAEAYLTSFPTPDTW